MNMVSVVVIFVAAYLWRDATTPKLRMTLLGYMVAFAVVSSIASLWH